MSSDKIIGTISIDGSAIANGTPNATAGYGMVIKLNDSIAEYKSILCPGCDRGLQTNNRAELRAAESALNFLHELAKIGHHKHYQLVKCGRGTNRLQQDYNYISDDRNINASCIVCIIRTDSTYVEKGATGINGQMRHKDVWETINNTMACLTRGGMEIRFNHTITRKYTWEEMRFRKASRQFCTMVIPVEVMSVRYAKELLEADMPWNNIFETNMGTTYDQKKIS